MTSFVARSKKDGPGTRLPSRSPRRERSAPKSRFIPRLDPMEARTLLSTLTVMNDHDSGSGSLRAAIAAASSGDTIKFAKSLNGQTIALMTGELDITTSLDIDGPGAGQLTVSGGGASRVFAIAGGADVALSGLTIANGVAVQGGGIDNSGTLTVDRCTLLNNKAVGGSGDATTPDAANGGGIANEVGASLTLTKDLLTNNVAAASPGNDSFGGALLNLASGTVTACTFNGNQSTGGGSSSFFDGSYAGAIESFGSPPPDQLYNTTLSVIDSTFTANESDAAAGTDYGQAGAIDLEFGAVATINNSRFTGNLATGGPGCYGFSGAINLEGCTLTVTNSSFTGNQAIGGTGPQHTDEAGAGALGTDGSGTTVANLTNCSFTGNRAIGGPGVAGFGGAIVNYGGALSDTLETMTLTNCTLTGNQAVGGTGTGAPTLLANRGAGGGIDNLDGGILTIVNSTLSGNQAIGGSGNPYTTGLDNGFALGGGIENSNRYGASTLTIINSTLFDNLARGGTNTSGTNGQGRGGGIDNQGSIVNITGGALIGNQAVGAAGGQGVPAGDGFGGGLSDWSSGTASVTNTTFAGNLAWGGAGAAGATGGAGLGGGIAVSIGRFLGLPDTASLAVSGSTLTGNKAQGGAGGSGADGGAGWGGGLFAGAGGSALLQQTTVTANTAMGGLPGAGGSAGDGVGGGLYIATGASVFLKKTKVKGNVASTSNDNIYGIVTSV
jgi:hypothetical protein